ncbi:hypothetical protein [Legionella yabuuchiae]|uniref:hypothetical protein n=1 Tax=Legionella yabuuchiae TaxID=376727 RepID=UPI00105671A5|nr:hypothetical protein [Legionella yabuuchiae]
MKLFAMPSPNDGETLFNRIMQSAIDGPQKFGVEYFNRYFSQGGSDQHPILGDLRVLADEIDRRYGDDKGMNLVSGLIRHRLPPLNEPRM